MPKIFIFKKFQRKESSLRAFSLIELSIVLVIVGLLIAGITSGKNLVRASKLSSAQSITLSSQIVVIPGMVLWVEPTNKDSFLNTEIVDSSQMTTWYNREPSGFLVKNNLTASASADAVYKELGINDLPSINMTVAGKMSVASFSGSALSASTVVIVFKPASLSGTAEIIADAGVSNPTSSIGIKNTGVNLNAGASADFSTTFTDGISYIVMVYFNGASSQVFSNSITAIGTITAGTNVLNGLTIGANSASASGIDAEISEVIVYNRILKDTERSDVMSYLSKKYKITVAGL